MRRFGFLAVMLVLLGGCKKKEETSAAPESSAPAQAVTLPAALAQKFLVYPAAIPTAFHEQNGELQVTYTTPDDLKVVQDFYRKALKDAGWNVSDDIVSPGAGFLSADKGGQNYQVALTAASPQGATLYMGIYSTP